MDSNSNSNPALHDRSNNEFRPHLNVVVGGDCSDGSEDLQQDMRSRMQSFAINVEDGSGMPDSTVFIEDSDVILPSTSTIQGDLLSSLRTGSNTLENVEAAEMRSFVGDFFKKDQRFGKQRESETNFLEEIFTEKPPKILENYLFGPVVGDGSYSKVKEVIHVRTLERRAVKIIKDRRLRKIPGGEQNVQREIEVLQRLNHPNVVKVVDIFRLEEKQKLYIVMEFCVCSIQQLLDNCPEKMLPEFQAHLYFTQMIDGLDFLHSQRIIHKDIKPGNLLLSLNGILKICDLGVAELLDLANIGDDWCTLVQGTPKFQPPEVVSGTQKRFRGRLVDIWACGVTLYNMVSGCYPFDGDVIMKLFENITTAPMQMPPNVSDTLKQLLWGVLEKEPRKRWDSLKIRASKWFTSSHQIDRNRIVQIPVIKDIPAHRPMKPGIYDFLAQLYARNDDINVDFDELRQAISDRKCEEGGDEAGVFEKTSAHWTPSTGYMQECENNKGNTAELKPILTHQNNRKCGRRRIRKTHFFVKCVKLLVIGLFLLVLLVIVTFLLL